MGADEVERWAFDTGKGWRQRKQLRVEKDRSGHSPRLTEGTLSARQVRKRKWLGRVRFHCEYRHISNQQSKDFSATNAVQSHPGTLLT